MIDHALLRPNLDKDELEQGIQVGLDLEVASICILPHYLPRLVERVQGTKVRSSTVIGFPHGSITREAKLFEAQDAIDKGCEELDVVVNISRVLSYDWDYVRDDLAALIYTAHTADRKVKVIFENAYLQESHKIPLIELSSDLGADWIKTSTGFASSGATLEDIHLMRAHAPDTVQIKASGGISDLSTLQSFANAGASRIGTSSAQKILAELAQSAKI
jgi:deoxyribose-phosphate aldolase